MEQHPIYTMNVIPNEVWERWFKKVCEIYGEEYPPKAFFSLASILPYVHMAKLLPYIEKLESSIATVRADERERCAGIANSAFFEVNDGRPISAFQARDMSKQLAHQIAEKIRAG